MAFFTDQNEINRDLLKELKYFNEKNSSRNFLSDSTRASRKGGADTGHEPGDSLEGIISTELKGFWKKISKDYTDSHVAERMTDSHDKLIEGIDKITDDLSKGGMRISKNIADAYKDIVSKSKGNKTLQVEADKTVGHLHSYSAKVTEMDKLLKENADGYRTGMNKEFTLLNKEITALAVKLKKAGIEVETVTASKTGGPKSRKWKASDPNLDITEYSKDLAAGTDKIVDIHNNFAKNLESSYAREITGRAAVVAALFKFAVDIGSKFADVAQSRLQNVLDDTDFTTALRTGLSPDEMNAWNNANRNSLRLLGDNADNFALDSQKMMHSFGLMGEAALAEATRLNKIGMMGGIQPSLKTNNNLKEMSQMIQGLEGISSQEAVARLDSISNSMAFQVAAAGKDDAEKQKILYNQYFALNRIARATGFTSEYTQKLLEEQKNKRFGSLIEQVKSRVLAGPLLKQIEAATGKKATAEQETAWNMKAVGALSGLPKDNPMVQAFASFERDFGSAYAKVRTSQTETLGRTGRLPRGAGNVFALQGIGGAMGFNDSAFAQEGAAALNKTPTLGASTLSETFYREEAVRSQRSLNAVESMNMNIKEVLGGVGKNPVGGLASSLLEGAGNIGLTYLAAKGAGLLPKGGLIAGARTAIGGLVADSGLATSVGAVGELGAGAAAGAAAGVVGAGLGGYALGTIISDKLIAGTSLGDDIGSAMAHTLAFFGNDEAQASIDMTNKQNMLAGRQVDENGNVILSNDEQTEALKQIAANTEKQNKLTEEEKQARIATENKKDVHTQRAEQIAEQTRSQQLAGNHWTTDANTKIGKAFEAIG